MPTFRRFSALFGIGLLLALGFAPELARAQEAVGAPDGQSLDGQSQRTQQSFQAVYGPNCASREWVWQHTLAIDNAAMIAGPAASDGQDLSGQDDDVQLAFVAVWGPAAAREWLAEHDAALAHHVLPAPVGRSRARRPGQ